jgi:16S rRNA (guanine966-N2)-methyltransferase
MRVIGGEFRSRRLKSVPGDSARPTPDRLRETLFNILSGRIGGARFLDAYAGTGAIGIEALSRGAAHACFLERSRHAVQVIRENLASLGIESKATVVAGPALRAILNFPAGIVFLDPPYELENEYALAMDLFAATSASLVIAQHSKHFTLAPAYGNLTRFREVRQGDNVLSFYEPV